MKANIKNLLIFSIILAFACILLLLIHTSSIVPNGNCEYGYVDFNQADYDSMLYTLDGTWKKYNSDYEEDFTYANFPDSIAAYNDDTVYSISISVPRAGEYYGIILPKGNSDYMIEINGTVFYRDGIYNNTKSYLTPMRRFVFYADSNILNVRVTTTSNSDTATKIQSIIFGASKEISAYYNHVVTIDVLLTISILFAGIYFFTVSIHANSSNTYIYMALLCIICALRASTASSVCICFAFPNISPELYRIIHTIIPPAVMILISAYTQSIFSQYAYAKLYNSIVPAYILYLLPALLLPKNYGEILSIILMALIIANSIILYITAIRLLISRNQFALSYLASLVIFTITSAFDNVSYNSTGFYGYALSIGLLVFIIFHVYILLKQSRELFDRNRQLSESYRNTITIIQREETNFLSSHLKPHFLFNALNIIAGYSLFDTDKCKKITAALIVYLRQLFENDNLKGMNSLENELNLVKAFGYIETERFPNINIEYDLPVTIPDIQVPSLILQPLLENSVNHGIRKRSSKIDGHITITVENLSRHILFSIEDDGIGADEATINNALAKPTDNRFHSLYHIQLRLQELYNENLTVKSTPDIGTTISFKIPKEI